MKLKSSKKGSGKATLKEIPSSTASPGQVDAIIKALSGLEQDIDSMNEKIADIKKRLNQKAQKEIEKLHEEISQMATKEAESMIAEAREKAQSEAQRILTSGEVNLKDVKNKIDTNFNEAVDHVVSTVLKA